MGTLWYVQTSVSRDQDKPAHNKRRSDTTRPIRRHCRAVQPARSKRVPRSATKLGARRPRKSRRYFTFLACQKVAWLCDRPRKQLPGSFSCCIGHCCGSAERCPVRRTDVGVPEQRMQISGRCGHADHLKKQKTHNESKRLCRYRVLSTTGITQYAPVHPVSIAENWLTNPKTASNTETWTPSSECSILLNLDPPNRSEQQFSNAGCRHSRNSSPQRGVLPYVNQAPTTSFAEV